MSIVVEASGAQVLPPVGDPRVAVSSWHAMCAADADCRRKSPVFAELAGRLRVLEAVAS